MPLGVHRLMPEAARTRVTRSRLCSRSCAASSHMLKLPWSIPQLKLSVSRAQDEGNAFRSQHRAARNKTSQCMRVTPALLFYILCRIAKGLLRDFNTSWNNLQMSDR